MPSAPGPFAATPIAPSRYKLRIELVPERQWGMNLRAAMSATQWAQVSREVFAEAGGVCRICGGVGSRHPLECHEAWRYDENADLSGPCRTQLLVGLEALCPACHRVKHMGFAEKQGWLDGALRHLSNINSIGPREARAYLEWAYREQRRRSTMRFEQDIQWFRERFPGRLRADRATARAVGQP